MRVETTHHVDEHTADTGGLGGERYEYDIHAFSEAGVRVFARSYAGELGAHFLRIEIDGDARLMIAADLRLPLVVCAAAKLREEGKHPLTWLGADGYRPFPSAT